MFCQDWCLVKASGEVLTVEPLKCKCWSCELCAPLRARKLVREAFLGQPDTFLTLTVNPARFEDVHERARQLARAWRLLRQRAMRKYKYTKLPFLAVFEKTKNGEPHLHILLRCKWLDQKWLSEQMDGLIGAPIVDVRRVTGTEKIAAYVAKYVSKDPTRFEGAKRYWSSRDYQLPDPRDEEEPPFDNDQLKVVRYSIEKYVAELRATGFVKLRTLGDVVHFRYDWHHAKRILAGVHRDG